MAKGKATKGVKAERTEEVFVLLLNGFRRSEILKIFKKKYDLTERQTDYYIKWANDLFEQQASYTCDREFGKALRRYEDIYKRGKEKKDLWLCKSVQGDINKLLGLNKEKPGSLIDKDAIVKIYLPKKQDLEENE